MKPWHGLEPRAVLTTVALATLVAGCDVVANLGAYPDAGLDATRCGSLVAPAVTASCTDCTYQCQANGCYDGWWCDTVTRECAPPPSECSSATADAAPRD